MKKANILLAVLLIALILVAWGTQISNIYKKNMEYQAQLIEAKANNEKGLFQKAISNYEEALKISESREIRDLLLRTYRSAFDMGVVSASDYRAALETACELYPQNETYWELFLSFCLETNSYSSAYDAYSMCIRSNADSGKLHGLKNKVLYLYTVKNKTYLQYYRSPDGDYTVFDGKNWGVLNSKGEISTDLVYEFVSPISTSRNVMLLSTGGLRIIDADNVIQANLTIDFDETRAVNGNKIPICKDGCWQYFDYQTMEFVSGEYDEASAYTNGVAAVKLNGEWWLVNDVNNDITEHCFDDIKLYGNGEFTYDDVMIASVNGRYSVYDLKGERTNEFECIDADVYLGEAIAYKDATGKWGYINLKGEIIIKPQFDEAKSFSNGLAAVKVGDNWGFINTSGEIVIECQFMEADYFTSKGICMVSIGNEQYNLIQLRFAGK